MLGSQLALVVVRLEAELLLAPAAALLVKGMRVVLVYFDRDEV
jgi:hypothetical protein